MAQDTAHFTFRADDGREFQWHGGEYIEIGYTAEQDTGPFNNLGQPSYNAGEFVALDVINVWDYATGAPRIERTPDAFQERCEEWLAGDDDE